MTNRYESRFIGTAGTWYVFDTEQKYQTPLGETDTIMGADEIAKTLNAKDAEIVSLKADIQAFENVHELTFEREKKLAAEADALRARVAELEAALKPFVKIASKNIGWMQHGRTIEAYMPSHLFITAAKTLGDAESHNAETTETPTLTAYQQEQIARAEADKGRTK